MSFLEIAYAAEVSRYEDPEFEEMARKNCNESFHTRGKVIEELRTMIRDRGECNPRRMDDAYLLRFLRCRRFIPAAAHRLMVRYEEFRRSYAKLYNCDAFSLTKVKNIYGACIPESPDVGRIVVMRFGQWDFNKISPEDMVRCAILMEEIGVLQPKIQVLGITAVIDLSGLGLQQVTKLSPMITGPVPGLMGLSFPILVHGLHVINYSWAMTPAFSVFKKLVPTSLHNRLHFHGSDLNSLHHHIPPKYLPKELGGHCEYFMACEDWIDKIFKYKDDFLVRELTELGFFVRDSQGKRVPEKGVEILR